MGSMELVITALPETETSGILVSTQVSLTYVGGIGGKILKLGKKLVNQLLFKGSRWLALSFPRDIDPIP